MMSPKHILLVLMIVVGICQADKVTKLEPVQRVRIERSTWKENLENIKNLVISIFKLNTNFDGMKCFKFGVTFQKVVQNLFEAKPNGTNALPMEYFLTTRNKRERTKWVDGEELNLVENNFDIRRPTVIIVHGFLATGHEEWVKNMADAFLQWGDVNVIAVDWSAGGDTFNYLKAAINTKIAGYRVARFLEEIADTVRYGSEPVAENSWGTIHCVGHSLGSHICGSIAKERKKIKGLEAWKLTRITALDPAQPCFQSNDTEIKLRSTDAPFVDVIHTNSRVMSKRGFGLWDRHGHIDFYPNGGHLQPGCTVVYSGFIQKLIFRIMKKPIILITQAICSHGRSYIIFTESILMSIRNNCTFGSRKWDQSLRQARTLVTQKKCIPGVDEDCIEMGINAFKYETSGSYFTVTSGSAPFCDTTQIDVEGTNSLMVGIE